MVGLMVLDPWDRGEMQFLWINQPNCLRDGLDGRSGGHDIAAVLR